MNDLINAIYTHATTPTNAFIEAVLGRFTYGEAIEGCAYPYAVFHGMPSMNDDTMTETIEDSSFQVNVFCDSAADAGRILKLCRELFDGAVLTVANHKDVTLNREMQTPPWIDGLTWAASIEFNALTQEI